MIYIIARRVLFIFITLMLSHSNLYAIDRAENELVLTLDKTKLLLYKLERSEYIDLGSYGPVKILIDKMIELDPSIPNKRIIDINCGLGEVASFLMENGFDKVYALSASDEEIAKAKQNYPDTAINFTIGNPLKINNIFQKEFFSVILVNNFASLLQDKIPLFQQLKSITKPGGYIALIDYTEKEQTEQNKVATSQSSQKENESHGGEHLKQATVKKSTYPIEISKLSKFFLAIDLKPIEIIDVTQNSKEWCKAVLAAMDERYNEIVASGFTKDEISLIKLKFESLQDQLKKGEIGTSIIILQRL